MKLYNKTKIPTDVRREQEAANLRRKSMTTTEELNRAEEHEYDQYGWIECLSRSPQLADAAIGDTVVYNLSPAAVVEKLTVVIVRDVIADPVERAAIERLTEKLDARSQGYNDNDAGHYDLERRLTNAKRVDVSYTLELVSKEPVERAEAGSFLAGFRDVFGGHDDTVCTFRVVDQG